LVRRGHEVSHVKIVDRQEFIAGLETGGIGWTTFDNRCDLGQERHPERGLHQRPVVHSVGANLVDHEPGG
jgi:hypothetical protein